MGIMEKQKGHAEESGQQLVAPSLLSQMGQSHRHKWY